MDRLDPSIVGANGHDTTRAERGTSTGAADRDRRRGRGALVAAGLALGAGMGGFFDGITFHQLLQWHQMLSTTERWGSGSIRDMEVNMFADGLFHAVTWILVAVGVGLLWYAARRGATRWTWRTVVGAMGIGWGAFNLVEGTVNHHLLEVHRVRPEAAQPLIYDLAFLASGVVLIAVGWWLQHRDRPSPEAMSHRVDAPTPRVDTTR